MIKNKKFLIIIGALFGVLLIAGGAFFFLQQRKSPVTPEKKPQTERRGPLVTPPPAEEMPYEIFQTEDGNLSFEYPSAWTRTEIKNLETILPKEFIDKYELTMPLILSDTQGAQVSLSTYRFDRGLDLNGVMDVLIEELLGFGLPYKEIGRKIVGDALVVDSTVEVQQGVTMRIKDMLFLSPNEAKNIVYNLSFTAHEPNWGEYETIFSHIQDSTKLHGF